MNPDISIIIPCFNSGRFLPEAIDSVRAYQGGKQYEIIVVDDGSTDGQTLDLLQSYSATGITVIHQENKGPAAARNEGVRRARAPYLLFLDSDNKIRPAYIDRGIGIMESNEAAGVVYGDAAFFGDSTEPRFVTRPFNSFDILMGNYIDMCSVVRRSTWEALGGFDEARILFGHEDWEFWIRVAGSQWTFIYVQEVLFDYRIRHNSIQLESHGESNIPAVRRYVHNKHLDKYIRHHFLLYEYFQMYQNDQDRPVRSFLKYLYRKWVSRLPPMQFK